MSCTGCGERIKRFIGAATDELAARAGGAFVPREEYHKRKAACETCEHRINLFCNLCGCVVAAKIRFASQGCPDGKWNSLTRSQESGDRGQESRVKGQGLRLE